MWSKPLQIHLKYSEISICLISVLFVFYSFDTFRQCQQRRVEDHAGWRCGCHVGLCRPGHKLFPRCFFNGHQRSTLVFDMKNRWMVDGKKYINIFFLMDSIGKHVISCMTLTRQHHVNMQMFDPWFWCSQKTIQVKNYQCGPGDIKGSRSNIYGSSHKLFNI